MIHELYEATLVLSTVQLAAEPVLSGLKNELNAKMRDHQTNRNRSTGVICVGVIAIVAVPLCIWNPYCWAAIAAISGKALTATGVGGTVLAAGGTGALVDFRGKRDEAAAKKRRVETGKIPVWINFNEQH
jgi:hypothetical protein